MDVWLLHARGLFAIVQTVQQAQVRALQDAALDLENALDELEEAESIAAATAAPGRWLNAHWQHAIANADSAAQRMFEIESNWLQQAQAQSAQRLEAVACRATNAPLAPALPWAKAVGNRR